MRLFLSASVLAGLIVGSAAFTAAPVKSPRPARAGRAPAKQHMTGAGDASSSPAPPASTATAAAAIAAGDDVDDDYWPAWSSTHGISAPKLSIRPPHPDERGKGGVYASSPIKALDTVASIPRGLVLSASADGTPMRAVEVASRANEPFSWAGDLTAVALAALHPTDDELASSAVDVAAKRDWLARWDAGGWATNPSDLGPPETDWGPKCVTGTLMATGSDNDHNIYAKFRFPCHPVLHRAGLGLALLTGCEGEEALAGLTCRGRVYRSMRDALLTLVEEPSPVEVRKGSLRERRAWDVADMLSKVLSRATMLEGGSAYAVVPLHERLGHCGDERGENVKLVMGASDDEEVLLVATRDIEEGEAITRDYREAPRLEGDTSEGALWLLLQFGLPPAALEAE